VRTKFSSELIALTGELTRLAGLAHGATERAAVAIAATDLTAAYEVFALDEQLQAGYGACENRAVILLALEAPVARDLRHVVSAIQIADDLSQMSWLLTRIADGVVRHYPHPVVPPDLLPGLSTIAEAAIEVAAATVEAIRVVGNSAPPVIVPDPGLHERFEQVVAKVSSSDWPHGSGTAVDIALLVHHYERCAQHCLRIGRLTNFFHTGVPLSAQSEETEEEA
jgi:phosphate transport system protein